MFESGTPCYCSIQLVEMHRTIPRRSGFDYFERSYISAYVGLTVFGGVKGRSQLPDYVERYMQGEIKIDEMITEVMPLEDINRAFDLMHEGKVIRSVIRY